MINAANLGVSAPKESEESNEYGLFVGTNLRTSVKEKKPIIEHVFYERDVICLSASPGVGKSILALQMLCNLTSGEDFLGTYTVSRPYKVLYLQTEGDRAETLERLDAMAGGMRINDSNWAHMNLDGICLNTPTGLKDFLQMTAAVDFKFEVIIIDPLYTTVKGSLLNDDIATDWVRNVRTIRKVHDNCSFIIVSHEGKEQHDRSGKVIEKKPGMMYGSTFWGAFVTYKYLLANRKGLFTLTSEKLRNKKIFDTIEMKLIEPWPLMYVYADEEVGTSTIQVANVLASTRIGMMAKELMDKTQLSKATVYRILKRLLQNGEIEKTFNNKEPIYRYIK